LFEALIGQWRYSLHTDKLSAAMQIAKRAYALAQEHHDSAVMIGACRVLAREQKSVSLEKRAEAKGLSQNKCINISSE